MNTKELIEKAKINAIDIITKCYEVTSNNKTILIYDELSITSKILSKGYELALKELKYEFDKFIFYDKKQEEIKKIIDSLNEKDLVILVQSSSFRMSKYRWRNLLFDQNLKVIEHPHLEKNLESEVETYINALNYDNVYYLKAIKFLTEKLENAKNIKIISRDKSIAEYSGPMDKIYNNIAYFKDKKNAGIRFPVGELFTESLNLEDLNGEVLLYAFPNTSHETQIVNPFKCIIKKGIIVNHKGPKEFDEIFKMIESENEEKEVFIREFGLGLNRGIKKFTRLGDISSYERLQGIHFSLGMKHGIFAKKLYPKYGKKFYQRYHIDVFIDLGEILIDDLLIYTQEKGWIIQ